MQQCPASKRPPRRGAFAAAVVAAVGSGILGLSLAAAANDKPEPGPRSTIRVRCGTLADKQGEQVLGRGSAGTTAQGDAARCPSNDREPRKPEPLPPVGVEKSVPVPAAPAVAVLPKPVSRARPMPPAARTEERIHIASEWEASEAQRRDRFAPTHAQRLSAVLVSGGVLWFLQSSFWASLLLLGLPIWRHVDLLAIVTRVKSDTGAIPTAEDERVAGVLSGPRDPHPKSTSPS